MWWLPTSQRTPTVETEVSHVQRSEFHNSLSHPPAMRLLYEDRLQRSEHDLLDSSHNNKYTHSANHVQVKEIRTRNDKLSQHFRL